MWKIYYNYDPTAVTPVYNSSAVIPPPTNEISLNNDLNVTKIQLFNGKFKYFSTDYIDNYQDITLTFSPLRSNTHYIDFFNSLKGKRIKIEYRNPNTPFGEEAVLEFEGILKNVLVAYLLSGKQQLRRLQITISKI